MRKFYFVLTCITLLLSMVWHAGAQSVSKPIQGIVLDKSNSKEIRLASIRNLNTGNIAISQSNGSFELLASPGQIIIYSAIGYYTDTLLLRQEIYANGNLILALRPLPSTLTDVTIVGNLSQYQIDSIERRKGFLVMASERPTPTVSRSTDMGFGVGINLGRWSKRERNSRKARSIFDMMEEEAYVNYRWNENIVGRYVTLEDEAFVSFVQRHRPTYQWLRKHPGEEDLMYYINSSLKKDRKK